MKRGWTEVALGELMPSRTPSIDPRRFPDEDFNLLSIPSFDAGAPERVVGSDVGSTKQIVEPGDVLLSKIVPHIRRAWIVPELPRRSIASSEWIVFRDPRAEPAYLRHLLTSDRFHIAFMQTVAGVGGSLLRARPAHVARIEAPLPPLEEQKRIAAILDKADELQAKRRAAIAHLDSLTQAIFIDMFGDPSLNTKGWKMAPVGDAVDLRWGDTSITKASYADVGVPAYSAAGQDGLLPEGQNHGEGIVVSAIGARCGRSFYVGGGDWTAIKNTMTILPVPGGVEIPYMFALAQSESFWPRNGGAQPFIAQGAARKVRMPVPPLELQRRFSEAFRARLKISSTYEQALELEQELSVALQNRAFRGEL